MSALESKQERKLKADRVKAVLELIFVVNTVAIAFAGVAVSLWLLLLLPLAFIGMVLGDFACDVIEEKIPASQVEESVKSWWLDKQLPGPGDLNVDPAWSNNPRSVGDAKYRIHAKNARSAFVQSVEPNVEILDRELSVAFGLIEPSSPDAVADLREQTAAAYKVPPTLGSYYRPTAEQTAIAREFQRQAELIHQQKLAHEVFYKYQSRLGVDWYPEGYVPPSDSKIGRGRWEMAKAHRKQAAKLKHRRQEFDSMKQQRGFKRPGSLNPHKQGGPNSKPGGYR